MNPQKKQKLLSYIFIAIGIISAFTSFYFYNSKPMVVDGEIVKPTSYLLLGFFCIVMVAFYLWKLNKIEIPETMVELSEGIKAYMIYLEKELKITIPENYEVYDTINLDDSYKTVLSVNDKTYGGKKYYPIQIFKKWAMNNDGEPFIQFGEGQGKETKNIIVVKNFLIRKTNNKNVHLVSQLEGLIDKKMQGD